jgi:murein DD-endopeptidase MepM/ murein hydrolase activator NlpD
MGRRFSVTKPSVKPSTNPTTAPKFSLSVVYPVSDVSRWYIAAGYMAYFPNYPKDQAGRIQYHTGLDYNLKTGGNTDLGEEVFAIADGIVGDMGASVLPGFGNIIMLEHPQFKIWSRYAHLQKFAKGITKNSVIRAGQLIGYVGKSGTQIAHLHFDILEIFKPLRFWGATDKRTVATVYADTLPWLKNHRAQDVGDA